MTIKSIIPSVLFWGANYTLHRILLKYIYFVGSLPDTYLVSHLSTDGSRIKSMNRLLYIQKSKYVTIEGSFFYKITY